MTEADLQRVLWVRAVEEGAEGAAAGRPAPWSPEQGRWATEEAWRLLGETAAPEALLSDRAQRLSRLSGQVWAAPQPGLTPWALGGLALAFGLGLVADTWASGTRLQLLSLPLVGLVGWNLLVVLWQGAALVRTAARPASAAAEASLPKPWLQPASALAQALLTAGRGRWRAPDGPHAEALRQAQAQAWQRRMPVLQLQSLGLLHLAAGLLALGLVASMYGRGLVLDFRAGWESTFLDAPAVRRALQVLLAPAIGWPGLALPDAAALDALRWAPGTAGSPAAPWIHRWALALLGWVVLPRLALGAWAFVQARRRAARGLLPLHEPYFQRLLRRPSAQTRPVAVLPYNCQLAAGAEAALPGAIAGWLGVDAPVVLAPTLPLGAEDTLPAGLPPMDGPDLVVLMNLNATPERETHGAFLQRLQPLLPPGSRLHLLLDSTVFEARLLGQPDAPSRRAQRLAAWQRLAEAVGVPHPHLAALGSAGGAAFHKGDVR